MAEDLTEKEAEDIVRQFNEGKANMHSFFTNVVKSPDTIKTGNLTQEELGVPKLPVRTYKELELFSKDIADEKEWGEYFQKMSEIQTASSLSKEGFFMKLAVTLKKELSDMTPSKKKNKGWFHKKDKSEDES